MQAFGLPGKLTINVSFLIPDTALESIALLVICILYILIASHIPGASLSIIALVASGVISLLENPVPPVLNIKLTLSSSLITLNSFSNISFSSGNMTCFTTVNPAASTNSFTTAPLLSSLSPA